MPATTSWGQVQPADRLRPVQAEQPFQDVTEFEGTTSFSRVPPATHRYKLSLGSNKLRVWLEDCQSKRQWCTSELSVESYINLNNAVPYATAQEYAENFHVLLSATVEDADEVPRAFKRTKDDAFRLEISMKFQVLVRTRVTTYSFDMEPISVEQIDVLESRMRDLQEEMKTQRAEAGGKTEVVELQETVKKLQAELLCRQAEISDLQSKITGAENKSLTIEATATTKSTSSVVCWSAARDYLNGTDGIIRNLEPGTYQVTATVNYHTSVNGQRLQLMKGGQTVQVVFCNYTNGNWSSGVLSRTMSVVDGDEISVVSTVNPSTTSYLTVTRVGS